MLATYHYQLEHIVGEPTVCGVAVPCNTAAFNIFGFISVPFLSLAAFLLITTLLLIARQGGDDVEDYIEDEIRRLTASSPTTRACPPPPDGV